MKPSRVDEVEYQRRLYHLTDHWGLSEVAILIHAKFNNIDIARDPWDRVWQILTQEFIYGADVTTRQVGGGYLGKEYAPGEVHDKPSNIQKYSVRLPHEPTAAQLKAWNISEQRRIKLNGLLSRIMGREIEVNLW